jgi:hypothetical protein
MKATSPLLGNVIRICGLSGLDFLVRELFADGEGVRGLALVRQIDRDLLAGRANENRRLEEKVVWGDIDGPDRSHACGRARPADARRRRPLALVVFVTGTTCGRA